MSLMKWLRRSSVLVVMCCMLLSHLGGPLVAAKTLDQNTLLFFANSGIYYYDPDACKDGRRCVAPTGDQITWIGDSYSVGALKLIQETFPGVDLGKEQVGNEVAPYSYIQGGKHTKDDGGSGVQGGKSGINILKEIVDEGELRPYLVFALGTNDTADAAATQKMMEEVADLVGNDTQVVITTASAKNQYQSDYVKANSGKKDFVGSHSNFSLADWAAVAKDEYFGDDTHPGLGDGYKVWVETIKNALPENCTDGVLLPGANINEKVWNWLVNYFNGQNLGNVNISALVSGILGNFQVETGVNPLMESSGYYGMFMLLGKYGGNTYASRVNAALGGNYFKFYAANNQWWDPEDLDQHKADSDLKAAGVSEEQIDTAIDINLKYMTEDDAYWKTFMEALKGWGVADTPEGYADLQEVVVERAYSTKFYPDEEVEEPVVSQFALKEYAKSAPPFYGKRFQGAGKRRKAARAFYEKYAGSTSVNPTITTGQAANVALASSSGAVGDNKNYNGDTVLSEPELEKIEQNKPFYEAAAQQYGVPWQAIAVVHRRESSLARVNPNGEGLYGLTTYTGEGKNSNAFVSGAEVGDDEFQLQTNLAAEYMKNTIEKAHYSVDSDEGIKFLFFNYNGTAPQYKKKALAMGFSEEEANVGEGSTYVMNRYDARRDPTSSEMDSNWPGMFTDNGVYTEGATNEEFGAFVMYQALGGGSGNGGDICAPSSTGNKLADYVLKYAWPEFKGWNFTTPMPDYKEAYDRRVREGKYVGSQNTYADCGGFVTTLLQESGFDPNYGGGGMTYVQENYVVNSPDWEMVNPSYNTPINDESELHPGDVAFSSQCDAEPGGCEHTYVYVGEIPGFSSHIASASRDKRSPMAVTHETIVGQGVNWYHKVK